MNATLVHAMSVQVRYAVVMEDARIPLAVISALAQTATTGMFSGTYFTRAGRAKLSIIKLPARPNPGRFTKI